MGAYVRVAANFKFYQPERLGTNVEHVAQLKLRGADIYVDADAGVPGALVGDPLAY